MLLNRHHLYGIVAVGGDTGENLVAELDIASDLLLLLGHTDMALIYKQRTGIRHEFLDFPFVRGGLPHLCGENLCMLILNDTVGIGGNTVTLSAGPMHPHLVELAVFQSLGGELHLPHPVADRCELEFGAFLPAGEISHQTYGSGIRGPFAEHPAATGTYTMKSEIFMCVRKIVKRPAGLGQLGFLAEDILMTSFNGRSVWFKPGVILVDR